MGYLAIVWVVSRLPVPNIGHQPSPCPGPMAYFIVTDHFDLAECETCGYIAISGTVYDAAHLTTPHKEGLAT